MRYSQLRAFHHVALNGGFSRAAEVLNQTQPSLSDQVRKLEQEFDVLLFHRDRKRVRLTGEGEALLLLTKRFFEAEENIREQLSAARAMVSGTLRIVADSAHHVTEALGAFREAYPQVFVQLHTGNSEQVLRALRNYDAEIGVVGSLQPAPDLDTMDLGTTPITAIAAKGVLPPDVRGLSLAQLAEWPLIIREQGSRTRAGLEAVARNHGVKLKPVIEVEGREAMREVVASGAGIGFVSEAEFGNDSRLIKVPLTGVDLGMSETVVFLSMRRDVPVIRAFMKAMQNQLKRFEVKLKHT